MKIDELLARARARMGTDSNAQLAYRLKLSPSALSCWTRGKSIPTEDNILALCNIAGDPPEPWFLALCQWRTSGASRKIYASIEAALEQRPFPLEAAE